MQTEPMWFAILEVGDILVEDGAERGAVIDKTDSGDSIALTLANDFGETEEIIVNPFDVAHVLVSY